MRVLHLPPTQPLTLFFWGGWWLVYPKILNPKALRASENACGLIEAATTFSLCCILLAFSVSFSRFQFSQISLLASTLCFCVLWTWSKQVCIGLYDSVCLSIILKPVGNNPFYYWQLSFAERKLLLPSSCLHFNDTQSVSAALNTLDIPKWHQELFLLRVSLAQRVLCRRPNLVQEYRVSNSFPCVNVQWFLFLFFSRSSVRNACMCIMWDGIIATPFVATDL